jgi:hypothetical protein
VVSIGGGGIAARDSIYSTDGTVKAFLSYGTSAIVGAASNHALEIRTNNVARVTAAADGTLTYQRELGTGRNTYQSDVLYANAALLTYSTSTAETSILPTTNEVGERNVVWKRGRRARITVRGYISTAASAPTLTFRVKIGTTTVLTIGGGTLPVMTTASTFALEAEVMCYVYAASGSLFASGQFQVSAVPGTFGAAVTTAGTTTTTAMATNGASYAIDVTAQFGTSNAANTINVLTASIEYLT